MDDKDLAIKKLVGKVISLAPAAPAIDFDAPNRVRSITSAKSSMRKKSYGAVGLLGLSAATIFAVVAMGTGEQTVKTRPADGGPFTTLASMPQDLPLYVTNPVVSVGTTIPETVIATSPTTNDLTVTTPPPTHMRPLGTHVPTQVVWSPTSENSAKSKTRIVQAGDQGVVITEMATGVKRTITTGRQVALVVTAFLAPDGTVYMTGGDSILLVAKPGQAIAEELSLPSDMVGGKKPKVIDQLAEYQGRTVLHVITEDNSPYLIDPETKRVTLVTLDIYCCQLNIYGESRLGYKRPASAAKIRENKNILLSQYGYQSALDKYGWIEVEVTVPDMVKAAMGNKREQSAENMSPEFNLRIYNLDSAENGFNGYALITANDATYIIDLASGQVVPTDGYLGKGGYLTLA
jgi:hypothetical protein